ncbi:ferredoxin, partial [Tribonema minus]
MVFARLMLLVGSALSVMLAAEAFLVAPALQRPVQRDTLTPRMLFGKKAAPAKSKGIEVTVQQKYFKDTVVAMEQPGNLRKALMGAGIEIYPLQGKIYNCGGGGSCGTCTVNVVAGGNNCSPKGPAEKKLLGNKPETYRLSCCTKVNGNITVATKP